MDFVVGLPRTKRGNDSKWVIVDRLTKLAHFLLVKTTYTFDTFSRIYIREMVRLHAIPDCIVSDRGSTFTSRFWMSFQEALGTELGYCSAFHRQTDGQTERMNQVMEYMLRAVCLIFREVGKSTYH